MAKHHRGRTTTSYERMLRRYRDLHPRPPRPCPAEGSPVRDSKGRIRTSAIRIVIAPLLDERRIEFWEWMDEHPFRGHHSYVLPSVWGIEPTDYLFGLEEDALLFMMRWDGRRL